VRVDLTYDHIILTSFLFDPKGVCSWGIAISIKGTRVWNPPLVGYIFPVLSFLTKQFPFSYLHENVGAPIEAEILLLPPTLRNYQGGDGVEWPNMSKVADSLDESYA
jgi:hypothetical protein